MQGLICTIILHLVDLTKLIFNTYLTNTFFHRLRVENMERQLANLTGIVQKALIHPPHPSPSPRDYLQIPAGREPYTRSAGTHNFILHCHKL